MSSASNDTEFLKVFGWVLGSLVAFTFFIVIVANTFSPASSPDHDPLVIEQTKGRIMPVGMSRVAQ